MDIVTDNKKIMKRFQWLFLFLCVTSGNCVAACYPGFQTDGGTSPYGDINILVGDDLVINCTLNIDYVGPSSPNDIIWRFNGQQQLSTSKYVTVLDNRTSQLVLPKMTRRDDGTYTCQLKRRPGELKDQTICSNRVRVAEPLPKQLSQFDCISIELKNMTCTWPAPSYGIPTDWSLTYKHFKGYYECSQYLIDETSKDYYGCLFSVSSNPPYDTSKLDFIFTLTGKNNISETSTRFRVSHYSRVVAAPPAYFRISSIGVNNINVSWAVNSEFSKYQLPMVYRLTYSSQGNPGNLTSIEVVNVTNYVLTGLSPWTVYTVTIRCRVQLAPDEDKMWSSSLTVTNRTHENKEMRSDCEPDENIESAALEDGSVDAVQTEHEQYVTIPPRVKKRKLTPLECQLLDLERQRHELKMQLIQHKNDRDIQEHLQRMKTMRAEEYYWQMKTKALNLPDFRYCPNDD